jgi:alpha-amylase/alpha-mannosidase (GH57 family)
MRRFICVHGHFYQPPREDPWTREVPREPSAAPYHDWNEKIAAECYGPNASSPLLDDSGKIAEVVNNYGRISFDMGPTLLRWLEPHYSELHESIVSADRESVARFSGHGSAMAQVYNHMIMPLATRADKATQTRWGIEDFERRFGRFPEGMWLPETAVDAESLEVLAEEGIKFTVLSPRQAQAIRKQGGPWIDVTGGSVDTRRAYSVRLASGKSISAFFYDDRVSNGIAFGDTLSSGVRMSGELLGRFGEGEGFQLVNVASDGETYGHHHKNGHIALTRALSEIEKSGRASLANYALFLSLSSPDHEVRLLEPSAWSCAHGVERWRSNCGCGSEIKPGYNQRWRAPLRTSLDWLRDRLAQVYSDEAEKVFSDPIRARERFGESGIGDHSRARDYVSTRVKKGLPRDAVDRGVDLMEMVEYSALMYASCAWFWEDISRPETRQMLSYASRAMELATSITGADLRGEFRTLIGEATPNNPGFHTGTGLFSELVTGRSRG